MSGRVLSTPLRLSFSLGLSPLPDTFCSPNKCDVEERVGGGGGGVVTSPWDEMIPSWVSHQTRAETQTVTAASLNDVSSRVQERVQRKKRRTLEFSRQWWRYASAIAGVWRIKMPLISMSRSFRTKGVAKEIIKLLTKEMKSWRNHRRSSASGLTVRCWSPKIKREKSELKVVKGRITEAA